VAPVRPVDAPRAPSAVLSENETGSIAMDAKATSRQIFNKAVNLITVSSGIEDLTYSDKTLPIVASCNRPHWRSR
jgi:hypothetical protein